MSKNILDTNTSAKYQEYIEPERCLKTKKFFRHKVTNTEQPRERQIFWASLTSPYSYLQLRFIQILDKISKIAVHQIHNKRFENHLDVFGRLPS